MLALLVVVGGVVSLGLLFTLTAVWRGYVLSVLWRWFMVEQFRLPVISIPESIGLALVVHFLTYQNIECQKEKESAGSRLATAALSAVLAPAMALLIGWIVHKFL